MKLTRLVLACTLLLLAASPLFAAPQCGECINNICEYSPYSGLPCRYDSAGNCVEYFRFCTSRSADTVAADWTIASVEVSRPALEPAAVETEAGDHDACPAEEITETR